MTYFEIVAVLIGAVTIAVVLWKAIGGGSPPPEDRDMRGSFWSGGD